MNSLRSAVIGFLLLPLLSSIGMANEFLLGEETKGVTINVAEHTNLTVRARLQPRLDFGDLTISRNGSRYESESDL